MRVIKLDMGEEIVVVSTGKPGPGMTGYKGRKTPFRSKRIVVRGVGGGLSVGREGRSRSGTRMLLTGSKKLFIGTINGGVVSAAPVIGYAEDMLPGVRGHVVKV